MLRIGGVPLNLNLVRFGVRTGIGPRIDTDATDDLGVCEARDLDAFQQAGWRFSETPPPDFHGGSDVEIGRLARYSEKRGFVILTDRVLVRLPDDVDVRSLGVAFGRVDRLPFRAVFYDAQVEFSGADLETAIESAIAALQSHPGVVAEPVLIYNFVHRLTSGGTVSPEAIESQWEAIHLRDAWRVASTKGKGVYAAVIDLGFHLDSQLAIEWCAFVPEKGNPSYAQTDIQPVYHGTLCAGLIGARPGEINVTGAAPDVKLILIAVEKVTTQIAIANAIRLAAVPEGNRPGADVISCSLAPCERAMEVSSLLRTAVDDALASGRGNLGTPQPLGTAVFWADVDQPIAIPPGTIEEYGPVVCVGASEDDGWNRFSGYGNGLDFLAPRQAIVLGVMGSSAARTLETGTSVAAPQAAGVAALVLSTRPRMKATDLAALIANACDRQDARANAGSGVLNALKTVTDALQVPP